VLRFLKRWKDLHFPAEGHAAPIGIGLTIAAYQWFSPQRTRPGYKASYDDLGATEALVKAMLSRFTYHPRLEARLPVQPHTDVFTQMTRQQVVELRGRLQTLSGWLSEARSSASITPRTRAFGDDFPKS